ncbi:MAG: four helix bundle protein, partial [Caldisericaceae bacterium]|nr:four helix bundle protein [Caldisericaceae bacterium]
LYIALGSASEIDTQLMIAEELGYIKYIGTDLEDELSTIGKMLNNLIKRIKQRLTHKTPPNS